MPDDSNWFNWVLPRISMSMHSKMWNCKVSVAWEDEKQCSHHFELERSSLKKIPDIMSVGRECRSFIHDNNWNQLIIRPKKNPTAGKSSADTSKYEVLDGHFGKVCDRFMIRSRSVFQDSFRQAVKSFCKTLDTQFTQGFDEEHTRFQNCLKFSFNENIKQSSIFSQTEIRKLVNPKRVTIIILQTLSDPQVHSAISNFEHFNAIQLSSSATNPNNNNTSEKEKSNAMNPLEDEFMNMNYDFGAGLGDHEEKDLVDQIGEAETDDVDEEEDMEFYSDSDEFGTSPDQSASYLPRMSPRSVDVYPDSRRNGNLEVAGNRFPQFQDIEPFPNAFDTRNTPAIDVIHLEDSFDLDSDDPSGWENFFLQDEDQSVPVLLPNHQDYNGA